MRRDNIFPLFDLTTAQREQFKNYGPLQAIRETIAARIVSRDPSALQPTSEQLCFVADLARKMGLEAWNALGGVSIDELHES